MFTAKADRPYLDAWLRRTRKQFAISGRLSQTAWLLAGESGDSSEMWTVRLRNILEGNEQPSLELLTQIDAILSQTISKPIDQGTQGQLW